MCVISNSYLNVTQYLIKAKANAVNKQYNIIVKACKINNADLVRFVLDAKALANIKNKKGLTLITIIISVKQADLCEMLLRSNLPLNLSLDKLSLTKKIENTKTLLKIKAYINKLVSVLNTTFNQYMLYTTAYKRNLDLLKKLLKTKTLVPVIMSI
jgi:ankyrin repeat protein